MMDRSHWLSLGVGLGAGVALWFRAPPPWRLAPALSAATGDDRFARKLIDNSKVISPPRLEP